MTSKNWIGTQDLDPKIQKLVVENDVVFIKFKYSNAKSEVAPVIKITSFTL